MLCEKITLPSPIIDAKEEDVMKDLIKRSDKLTKPGVIAKLGKKATDIIPVKVKNVCELRDVVTENELYIQCLKVATDGFIILEKQAAKFTVNEDVIVKKINDISDGVEISSIHEICLARSYNISKLVNDYKKKI